MKPHLFIASTMRRTDLSDQVRDWWARHGYLPEWIVCTAEPGSPEMLAFDRHRRIVAEHAAPSSIYILTDDDILPRDDFNAEWFAADLEAHPSYAMISAWLDNEPLGKQVAAGPDICGCLMSELDVGGLRAVRRGVIAPDDFPPSDGSGAYDHTLCEFIRTKRGRRVGYDTKEHATHLGKGRSEIWSAA